MSVPVFSRVLSGARVLAVLPDPRTGAEPAPSLADVRPLPQPSVPVPGPGERDLDTPLFAELAGLWEAFGRSVPTRPDPQWDALLRPPGPGRHRG